MTFFRHLMYRLTGTCDVVISLWFGFLSDQHYHVHHREGEEHGNEDDQFRRHRSAFVRKVIEAGEARREARDDYNVSEW